MNNSEFIIAAYVIGAVCIKGYALWLFISRAKIKKQIFENATKG